MKLLTHLSIALAAMLSAGCATTTAADKPAPLLIQSQGSFAVGGRVLKDPDGKTFHGDHAAVSWQAPVNARPYPLVLLHGAGQSGRTWGTTPDGREGFQTLFLRRNFAVYTMDQPRRGTAGRSTEPLALTPARDEQASFNIFRLGIWPDYFAGVAFPRGSAALEQYFRQMTPNTGPYDAGVISDATAALFDRIGPALLVTHSQGGGPGWLAAIKSRNVRGIVAFEPGSGFIFPPGQVPPPMPSSAGTLEASAVPMADFMQLTRVPIVIYYGDNIPAEPVANPGQDNWRVRLQMARLWADAVNRAGGQVSLVHLPEKGIYGNTHFPFSDLNSLQIADLVSSFLHANRLD